MSVRQDDSNIAQGPRKGKARTAHEAVSRVRVPARAMPANPRAQNGLCAVRVRGAGRQEKRGSIAWISAWHIAGQQLCAARGSLISRRPGGRSAGINRQPFSPWQGFAPLPYKEATHDPSRERLPNLGLAAVGGRSGDICAGDGGSHETLAAYLSGLHPNRGCAR
jgi:hypothetical protein